MNTAASAPVNTYFFEGKIKTLSPLTFSPPGSMQKRGAATEHCFPLMNNNPVYYASGIRGKLRRIMTEIVREELSAATGTDYRFTLEDYFFNVLGGVKKAKAKKEKGATKVDDEEKDNGRFNVLALKQIRERNPVVSMFGAMAPSIIGGSLEVSHAIATTGKDTSLTRIQFVRSDDFLRSSDAWSVVDDDAYDTYATAARLSMSKSAEKVDRDAITAQLRKTDKSDKDAVAALKADLARLDDSIKGNTEVSVSQLLNYEVITPGTELEVRFVLKRASERELSLFLNTLARFAQYPRLGSHLAHGCGLVSMDLMVKKQGRLNRETIGTVKVIGDYDGLEMSDNLRTIAENLDLTGCDFTAKAGLGEGK